MPRVNRPPRHRSIAARDGAGVGVGSGRAWRLALVMVCAVVLGACRVDVTVDVAVDDNGAGEVTVTVVADPAVVAAAPGLADDVRTDDLAAAGWTTDGAVATADGGLRLVLVHPFRTPEQATALLSTLNGPSGPLQAILIERTAALRELTFTVRGSGVVDGGLDAFADSDLLAAVGGSPYATRIAEAGGAPDDVLGVRVRISLPGEVQSSTGTVVEADPASGADSGAGSETDTDADSTRSVVAWDVALDGTTTAIEATSVRSLERGGFWRILAGGLFVAVIAWIVLSVVLIALVVRSQRRRHRAADRLERLGRM